MIELDNDQIDLALAIAADTADARQIDTVLAAIAAQDQADVITTGLQAAYLNGFIQESARQIEAMIARATTADARRELLPAVERIKDQIEAAAAKLEALTHG